VGETGSEGKVKGQAESRAKASLKMKEGRVHRARDKGLPEEGTSGPGTPKGSSGREGSKRRCGSSETKGPE